MKFIVIFLLFLSNISYAANNIPELTNQKINLILKKEKEGIYKLPKIKKNIIITFFDENNKTINPELSKILNNNGLSRASQNFLLKVNISKDYIGSQAIKTFD